VAILPNINEPILSFYFEKDFSYFHRKRIKVWYKLRIRRGYQLTSRLHTVKGVRRSLFSTEVKDHVLS
jgi:hypothetical protein